MPNEEYPNLLKQGVKAWNQWLREHLDVQPNLSGAYLSGAKLIGANLSRADLFGADLDGANLSGASFWEANVGYTTCLLKKSEASHSRPKNSFSTSWFIMRSPRVITKL